jgi:Xaa-Pro dipeptidase
MITPYELTPAEEIKARIHRFQERMTEKGIELALIMENADLFYFAGTIQKGYLVIPQKGEAIFFVQKDVGRATQESPLKCVKTESPRNLPKLLEEHNLMGKTVGMELDVVPVALYQRIQAIFRDWEVVDLSQEIKRIRSIKSDFEIRQVKKAGEIVTRVFTEAKDHLQAGMAEVDLDGILTSIGRALGHQGLIRMRGFNQEMMNIHVLSGTSASVISYADTPLAGHGLSPAIAQGSSIRMIERDQPVVIDYGAAFNGYVTDETRTFVVGRLRGPLEKACRVALMILEEVESFARAGVLPVTIYERALEIARKEGLAPFFMGHGEGQVAFVGHGLGLEINEWPILGRGEKKPLQAGMVFALEPKFVFPGQGAVGIELDYIVRDDGLERVTQFPKEVIYL